MTPYLTHQYELLQAASNTSCWTFGQRVEAEYIASMVAAQKAFYGRDCSWYFLHIWHRFPASHPYIAYTQGGTTLVSINSTVDDFFWATINSPHTDQAYIEAITDQRLTADGQGGAIRNVLNAGGWPLLMNHWQAFCSNGLETGLAVLDLLGVRVSATLADGVEWLSCSEIAQRTRVEL